MMIHFSLFVFSGFFEKNAENVKNIMRIKHGKNMMKKTCKG